MGDIKYYENTGNSSPPQWTEESGLFSGFDVGSNAVFSIGDVNQDHNLDIITGDLFHEIQFFSYDNGSWVEYPEIVAGLTAGQNATPALADLNHDGDLDLAIGNYDGTFNYYENLTVVGIKEDHIKPQNTRLYPAHPNPFNPTTSIRQAGLSEIKKIWTLSLPKGPGSQKFFSILLIPIKLQSGHSSMKCGFGFDYSASL